MRTTIAIKINERLFSEQAEELEDQLARFLAGLGWTGTINDRVTGNTTVFPFEPTYWECSCGCGNTLEILEGGEVRFVDQHDNAMLDVEPGEIWFSEQRIQAEDISVVLSEKDFGEAQAAIQELILTEEREQ